MPKLLSEGELRALRLDIQEALPAGEQDIIDSLMGHIDAMMQSEIDTLKALESDANGLRRQLAAKDEAIIALQGEKSELLVRLERLQAQHDKAVTENKGLHTVVNQHNGIRVELEGRVKDMARRHNEIAEENYALRKRNGKLAKKLEMARI